jgi:glycogen synthase
MRVLMLSWEYPPLVIGGIATHVEGLAQAMAHQGHDVVVLSLHTREAADDVTVNGVRILRAQIDLPWLPEDNLVARMASSNHHVTKLIANLGDWRPDVVHTHDWLMAWAGDSIAAIWNVPMVATIHATERGRHGGHVPSGVPAAINSVEWWLTYQASRVICCSQFMTSEVASGFELPYEKIDLVPNGIDPLAWAAPTESIDRQPIVVAWGRVQYEKGFQVLARAVGTLRERVPGIRCVIAGRGSYLPELQSQIDIEGLSDVVQLAGFVSDGELRVLLHQAGCAVIPSLYEPFGIVALEAMAAGAATIVAETGGLAEIVRGSGAGLLFEPGNQFHLADQIAQVLTNPQVNADLCQHAAAMLADRYSWDAIAVATTTVYSKAMELYKGARRTS